MEKLLFLINITVIPIIWGVCITSGITFGLYVAFQRLDFSKMFKANSTVQIKVILLFVSLAIGCIIGLGFSILLNSILNLF